MEIPKWTYGWLLNLLKKLIETGGSKTLLAILLLVLLATVAPYLANTPTTGGVTSWTVYASLASILFSIVGMIVIYNASGRTTSEWRRRVPSKAFDSSVLAVLKNQLLNIHRLAETEARMLIPSLGLQDIRANVILPDYRRAKNGIACELHIHDQLWVNMKEPELSISFNPGEGVAGKAFFEAETYLLRDGRFGIHPSKHEIHKDLKWVLSVVLRHPQNRDPLGVLNIDYVGDKAAEFESVVPKIVSTIQPEIDKFAETLSRLPQITISIIVERE